MRYLLENQWWRLNNIIPACVCFFWLVKLVWSFMWNSDLNQWDFKTLIRLPSLSVLKLVHFFGIWGFGVHPSQNGRKQICFEYVELPLYTPVCGRLLSFWEGNFSGAMLNFGGVSPFFWLLEEAPKSFYNFIDTDLEAPTFEWISGSVFAIVGNLGGFSSRGNCIIFKYD